MKRKVSYRDDLVEAIRKWLPSQFFAQWKLRSGLSWTPQRLVWSAFLMVWSVDQTLTDRFASTADLLLSLFPHWHLGKTYTGWLDALAAWSPHVQPVIARRFRELMQAGAGRCWKREGWCAFAADGSRFECPRTQANQQSFGCAGKKRTGPQLYVTTLWHMGLGLPWDYRVGPGTASEREHLSQMLPDLPSRSLIVADAGFVGYDLCARIHAAGHGFLIRVGSNVHLLKKLGWFQREGKSTVYLWPEKSTEPPLVLRLIERRRGKKSVYLVTNVMEEKALSKRSVGVLYEMRWGVEVFYRTCKQTLQKRKMRSDSPRAAELELTWAVLGVWLLGLMSVMEIVARGGDPLGWSAALARKAVREWMRRAPQGKKCGRRLPDRLAEAVQDGYERHGSKEARDWPHKKRDKPPGAPKIKVATAEQRKKAKRLRERTRAA